MKFRYCTLSLTMILLFGCKDQTDVNQYNPLTQDGSLEVLDETLMGITDIWKALPASISTTNESLTIASDTQFMFLRLQKEDCNVCAVNTISYINEFQSTSQTGLKLYLITDQLDVKEKANFLSSFQLKNIEVAFIESELSALDQIGSGSYFGYAENGQITDAIPVNQLFVKDFIFSFLEKRQIH